MNNIIKQNKVKIIGITKNTTQIVEETPLIACSIETSLFAIKSASLISAFTYNSLRHLTQTIFPEYPLGTERVVVQYSQTTWTFVSNDIAITQLRFPASELRESTQKHPLLVEFEFRSTSHTIHQSRDRPHCCSTSCRCHHGRWNR